MTTLSKAICRTYLYTRRGELSEGCWVSVDGLVQSRWYQPDLFLLVPSPWNGSCTTATCLHFNERCHLNFYRSHLTTVIIGWLASGLELCMGMGIPVGMGFPWESHGNGNRFGLWTGMGMGMGKLSREWEWRIFLYVKNSHYWSRQMCRSADV